MGVGTSRAVLQGGLHLLTLIYWEQQGLVSSKQTAGDRDIGDRDREIGLGNSRAARDKVMFTALPAKTSSLRSCCVVQCLCWLLQLPQLCTHQGKPGLCHIIAAVGHQRDTGVSGSSGQVSCSPPIPAQKPEQTNQQHFESQNQWRTRIVPSPTALGPVFPEFQVAQLSGEALCLVSGAAPVHAIVGLMHFWAFLHSCCSSCIFRNTDGSLQILIILWLRLLFECNKQTQTLQYRPRGHPEYLYMLGNSTMSISMHSEVFFSRILGFFPVWHCSGCWPIPHHPVHLPVDNQQGRQDRGDHRMQLLSCAR